MTPEEGIAKAIHESDWTNCIWPYPEHDEEMIYEDEEVWRGRCRRCDAELFSYK